MHELQLSNTKRCRQVALQILKPSARDLDYGLQLHKEALVIESYGLGLHAPVHGAEIMAAAERGASALECQDLFEEMIMTGWLADESLQSEYQDAWEIAGVNCIFINAGEEHHDPRRLIKRLSRYLFLTDSMPGFLKRITNADDLLALQGSHQRGLCLTTNSIPLSGSQLNIEEELSFIQTFARLGVKMMHLTYNRGNLLGSGCAEACDKGLTDFGRRAVKELNRYGIIIDLAHSGCQTTIDTARASDYPVVVSHSAASALCPHIRCKTDETIRAVVDGGGTIGITNIPAFLGGGGTIESFLNHIEYVYHKFGADAATIGMDTVYSSTRSTLLSPEVRRCLGVRKRWEDFWPEGQSVFTPEWTRPEQIDSLVWTNWPLFTVGLVQRGLPDEAIRKILGLNIVRVANEVWSKVASQAPHHSSQLSFS